MIEFILAAVLLMQDEVAEKTSKPSPLQFTVTHDGTTDDVVTGRLYIMLTKGRRPLRSGPNWFHPEPFFAIDVTEWKANIPLIVSDLADAMDGPPSSIGAGPWLATAIFRTNNDSAAIAAPGGLYSESITISGSGEDAGTIELLLNIPIEERKWRSNKQVRLAQMQSPLLSEFYGRPMSQVAGIIVPEGYDPNREKPYPVMYWIGGFGSDHYSTPFMTSMFGSSQYSDQFCRVILNAQTFGGHHVFADSANNGPRMSALIQEFIPYIEETYNLGGSPGMRYVAGHSSGGWAALWLLVKNPDFFVGAWPLAPDPIDFHYFQTANLYASDANMFIDEQGEERPIARSGTTPIVFAKRFIAMDDVIKIGGQIASFEWVFSPSGSDGRPVQMFDRETGVVIPEVVEYWKRYDIRHYLESNWETLAPKLSGKINIVAGSIDTFYLENAVISLKEFFEEKNFDASVQVVEGWDHSTVFSSSVRKNMDEWFANKLGLVSQNLINDSPEEK